jgi:hypothetical protein
MKRFCLLFTGVSFFIVASFSFTYADVPKTSPLIGAISPISNERITIQFGDKAQISLGTKDGLIKGDIGIIRASQEISPEKNIGECAITRTEFGSSICEMIAGKKEIEKGNFIYFNSINYSDSFMYSLAMTTLANIVEPYEPYKNLRVCIYGIFDKSNAVTGLSKQLSSEFENIFMQKKRIKLVDRKVFPGLVIYPGFSSDTEAYLKTQMKRANVDVLLLAQYEIKDGRVKVTVDSIDTQNRNTTTTYAFPSSDDYQKSSSTVLLSPMEETKARNILCKLALKNIPRILSRDDRISLMNSESDGNALTENALRRIDFNMVNPVEVTANIDGELIDISDSKNHSILLGTGNHSISLTFKRGYFYNETLLYTSEKTFRKDAIISLSNPFEVTIDVSINSIDKKDPISLSIYHPTERQKQVLKPIYRVESDKTIETYKD